MRLLKVLYYGAAIIIPGGIIIVLLIKAKGYKISSPYNQQPSHNPMGPWQRMRKFFGIIYWAEKRKPKSKTTNIRLSSSPPSPWNR